jgi:type II secretory pathway component PulF
MSVLITPRQYSRRAELYHQLSQLTAAGIGLPQAIELQRRTPPSRSFREPLSVVSQRLALGSTFAEAMQCTGRWLPAFDGALIHAGEHSGRLPTTFKLLARHYESNAALLQKTISSLVYPALVFHMAVFIGPLPELFRSWNVFAYAAKTLTVLVPIYALAFFIVYALQGRHGEHWRSVVESLVRRIPMFGKARHNLALARLASALEALITAGVSIVEAWELAAAASGSPALRRAVMKWRPDVDAGVTPAEVVRHCREFPSVFANVYHTGEVTGSLDDALRRLHTLYQDEGERQLKAVAEWTPKLIFLIVAMVVAWQVIRFWTGYFDRIGDAINF